MSKLLDLVLQAHGGLDRWNKFNRVTATIVAGGGLLPMKGLEVDPTPLAGTVTIREETTLITTFGQSDWHMVFRPERVVIETSAGIVISEYSNPRASFAGHVLNTPWDLFHRGYFNEYARWTYLTTPFSMAMPGFEVTEISSWQEGGELWRGLRVRFPDEIASHSREQDFYFGDDFLLRRHDYHLDVAGGVPVAQYIYDIVEVDGLCFPTKRRAYVRGPHLKPIRDLLLISLDLSTRRARKRNDRSRIGGVQPESQAHQARLPNWEFRDRRSIQKSELYKLTNISSRHLRLAKASYRSSASPCR